MNQAHRVVGWMALMVGAAAAAGAVCATDSRLTYGCGTFTLQEENDSFALSDAADRGYTNGTRLLWSWTPAAESRIGRLAARLCPAADRGTCGLYATAGLGQSMYTPERLSTRRLIVGDRPYGGWLYGTLMLDAQRERWAEHVEAYVGVIGPAARAAEVQTFWHRRVTKDPIPRGWDNQIDEGLAVLLAYEHRWKLHELRTASGQPLLDVTPALGAAVGNVFDSAGAGVTVRAGYNLPPRFFQAIPAVPALIGAPSPDRPHPSAGWDAYLFAAADGRYVVHNVFLDTDRELYRIERRPLVRDHKFGASVRIRWVRLHFVQTFRSPEFHPDTRWQSYATWLITVGASP
jgi:lipid A 3-O-deacylase